MNYKTCVFTCGGCDCRNGTFITSEELDQTWVDKLRNSRYGLSSENREWLRTNPDQVIELAMKFPPMCLVEAVPPYRCPRPGTLGVVMGYHFNTKTEIVSLFILQHPSLSKVRLCCREKVVRLVDYGRGITPEYLKEVLEGNM